MSYDKVEQDYNIPKPGDELPTYEDLATQGGPNSRFGRWRGWIEKRAAERYADITPEERERRRKRGWGNDEYEAAALQRQQELEQLQSQQHRHQHQSQQQQYQQYPTHPQLSIQTNDLHYHQPAPVTTPPRLRPLPLVSRRLRPSHVKLNHFGSRFLPHTLTRVRCLLPLVQDSMLLVGHDGGLSVVDMFPQEKAEDGSTIFKGPNEAVTKPMWVGETVFQMDILEVDYVGDATPTGVVLLLVGGADGDKDGESVKTIRMYNLASLTSLAKWSISQEGARPVDLSHLQSLHPQEQASKRRPESKLFGRSFKSLIDPTTPQSTRHLLSPASTISSNTPDHWDIIEELPLRWATDYVSLNVPNSRLNGSPIVSYALWNQDTQRGKGGQLLAVAAKTVILLYEAPRNERAFQFIKEFYTPIQARSVTFMQQNVHEIPNHRRSGSTNTLLGPNSANPQRMVNYGLQLSLFVTFDKRASWIRLTDAMVNEVELYESPGDQLSLSRSLSHGGYQSTRDSLSHHLNNLSVNGARKSRVISEMISSPKWLPPAICEVPDPSRSGTFTPICLATVGRQTHILRCPLPTHVNAHPPCRVLNWYERPSQVVARHCFLLETHGTLLQIIAFGETGIEVQEISLSFLLGDDGKGKGKWALEEPIRAFYKMNSECGFLGFGGRWDRRSSLSVKGSLRAMSRSATTTSAVSYASDMSGTSSMASDTGDFTREEGIYGWFRKDSEDYRIFWVGGTTGENDGDDDTDDDT